VREFRRSSHSRLRLAGAAAFLSVLAVGSLSAALSAGATAHGVKLTIVATHLNNPRKIFLGRGGAVYVVEAGTGGRDRCLGTGATKTCIGLTGSIARIGKGAPRRVVTGLWSGARTDGDLAQGAADVIVHGRVFYILLQNGSINARGQNDLGRDGLTAGDLIASLPGKVRPKVIANLTAYEVAHNPDHGAGPGLRFGDPPIDSDPYAFVAYRGGFAVADAAANDLLWIGPRGTISLLAVFPTQTVPLTKAVAKQIGAPATMSSIVVQSVPSSVTVGPDGALYVGELTGLPFARGRARVWRVVPGHKPSIYASGFTNISDLAFDRSNLLVLEMSVGGLLDSTSPGALIRVAPGGKRLLLASAGLDHPAGLAVGARSIYISNNGVFPGAGSGKTGELVSVPASLGS
jgi:hypothetical protein